MKSSTVALSNGLSAIVSAVTVVISGVSIPTSQFDTAKPYVDRAKSVPTAPTLNVGGTTVSLVTPQPVIQASGYTFTLKDFDDVTNAIVEARKPKSVKVAVAPGIEAVVTPDAITVNGLKLDSAVLDNLLAAKAEVNS